MNWTCTICSECCNSANFQNSTVRKHYPNDHQPSVTFTGFASQNASPSDWQLGLLLINPSTAPLRPTYTIVFHPCCRRHPDDSCGLLPHIVCTLYVPPVRLCTVGKRAFPVSGAAAWNDLPLHVASAPSLAVFKTFNLFPVPAKTLSYDLR